MVEKDDINIAVVSVVGIISVALTIASVFAVQALYFNRMDVETQRKVVELDSPSSESRVAEQEAKLSRYAWRDQENEIVVIPIERAMSLVVTEMNQRDEINQRAAEAP